MHKSIAMNWSAMLRSEGYEQGQAALTTKTPSGKEYDCCLGVLCKLAIANGVKLRREQPGDQEISQVLTYVSEVAGEEQRDTGNLPLVVKQWAGMQTDSGAINDYRESLIAMNDDAGYSFEQIADTIDANWENL